MSTKIKECAMHPCVNCSKAATKICSACHDAPDGAGNKTEPTRYCTADCQEKHWTSHKKSCKASQDRKVLYRAGESAQGLFHVWREIVYDKYILKIDRTGNQMSLHEGFYDDIDDCFIPFPETLVKDEREKKALLTHLACNDAYGFMDVVIKKMLTGIYKELQDVPVMLQNNQPLKVRLYDGNGKGDPNFYQHEALKITLRDGSIYIMDIAAAQYGIDQPILPIQVYQDTRAEDIGPGRPFGYQRSVFEEICSKGETWGSAIIQANNKMYSAFNDCIESFENSSMPLTSLLRLKEDAYVKSQNHLVKYIHQTLDEYKRMAYSKGYFKVTKVSMVNNPAAQIKSKEETYGEDVGEFLGKASASGHEVEFLNGSIVVRKNRKAR